MSPAGMWSFSVSELAIPGAEIGRISATDADLGENAKLEYTILEGESGDTFNITGVNQEAVITLNKVGDEQRRRVLCCYIDSRVHVASTVEKCVSSPQNGYKKPLAFHLFDWGDASTFFFCQCCNVFFFTNTLKFKKKY